MTEHNCSTQNWACNQGRCESVPTSMWALEKQHPWLCAFVYAVGFLGGFVLMRWSV